MLIRTETILMPLKWIRPSPSEVDPSGSHLSIVGYALCNARPELIVIDHRPVGTMAPGNATAPEGLLLQGRGHTESYLSLASEYAEPKDHDTAVSLSSSVILCAAPRDSGGLTDLNWRIGSSVLQRCAEPSVLIARSLAVRIRLILVSLEIC